MKTTLLATALLTCTPLAVMAQAASAPAPSAAPVAPAATGAPAGAAVTACEQAVRDTLRSTRGNAGDVLLNAPPTAAPGASDGGELLLRGSGRVRAAGAARTFTYSCNYDTRSGTVAGVVLRDAAAAADKTVSTPVRTVEPDLSALSPAACESAAAAALKRRWPNVGRIAFNADTRSLVQDSAGTAKLEGQGNVQPQLGNDISAHFTYQCSVDARSGRVMALRLVD